MLQFSGRSNKIVVLTWLYRWLFFVGRADSDSVITSSKTQSDPLEKIFFDKKKSKIFLKEKKLVI